MVLLVIFLAVAVAVFVVSTVLMVVGIRRERRDKELWDGHRHRYEQAATLEGGGSHLSADRRR